MIVNIKLSLNQVYGNVYVSQICELNHFDDQSRPTLKAYIEVIQGQFKLHYWCITLSAEIKYVDPCLKIKDAPANSLIATLLF